MTLALVGEAEFSLTLQRRWRDPAELRQAAVALEVLVLNQIAKSSVLKRLTLLARRLTAGVFEREGSEVVWARREQQGPQAV
jgi:hypothetical protein